MAQQEKLLDTQESKLSTAVIGILLIVSGFLIYSYFQQPDTSDENVLDNSTAAEETIQGATDESETPETDVEINSQTASSDEVIHTVQKGESLWRIAEEKLGDGFLWKELAQVNNIPLDNPLIKEGQELVVSGFGGPVESGDVLSALTAEVTDEGVVTTEKYTVQRGDTLWSIAERVYGDGSRWQEIYNAPENNLSFYSAQSTGQTYPLIHEGNVLVIP